MRVTKLIINEQDVTVRTCKKVEHSPSKLYENKELEEAIKDTIKEYKEIIFGPDNPVCMARLNELRKKQVIDEQVYDQKLMEDTVRKLAWDELQTNIVMDDDVMLERKIGEVLDPKLISRIGKTNFKG